MLCHQKPGCYLAYYLNSSSGEFTSSSSHIYDSWYLPMFLLRDGSLTLMKMASLMGLAKFLSSLPTMLKCQWKYHDQWCYDGHRWVIGLSRALYIFLQMFCLTSHYILPQSTLPHLYLFITPFFCQMVSVSLGFTRRSLIVLPPLKYICIPCLMQLFLQLSLTPLM